MAFPSFLQKAKTAGGDAYSYLFEKQVKGGVPGEKELVKNMNDFMGNSHLNHCNKLVDNKQITFEENSEN